MDIASHARVVLIVVIHWSKLCLQHENVSLLLLLYISVMILATQLLTCMFVAVGCIHLSRMGDHAEHTSIIELRGAMSLQSLQDTNN